MKYHVHSWPSELLCYFATIRKTLKEIERDVNTLGDNTLGLLEVAYTWVIKKRFAWLAKKILTYSTAEDRDP